MRRTITMAVAGMLFASSAAQAGTIQLQPIPDAFARLGHSCGGIQQQIFGLGFDQNGNVTGYVYAQTRCGGSGKGGGYHVSTYATWVAVTWNLAGSVIGEVTAVPNPDPSIAGAYHSGGAVGGANYPACNNVTPYDNSFSCFSVPVFDESNTYAVETSLHVINQAACSAGNTSYCTYRGLLITPN